MHQVDQIYTFIEIQSLRMREKIKFQNLLYRQDKLQMTAKFCIFTVH